MSPYRTPSRPAHDAAPGHRAAEAIGVALLWLVVGAVPVVLAVLRHAHWGCAPSLGLLFLVFGAWCLVLEVGRLRRRRNRRTPRQPTLSELRKWTRSS